LFLLVWRDAANRGYETWQTSLFQVFDRFFGLHRVQNTVVVYSRFWESSQWKRVGTLRNSWIVFEAKTKDCALSGIFQHRFWHLCYVCSFYACVPHKMFLLKSVIQSAKVIERKVRLVQVAHFLGAAGVPFQLRVSVLIVSKSWQRLSFVILRALDAANMYRF